MYINIHIIICIVMSWNEKPVLISQLIYWEDKHFYLEHEFISLTDNFVRAVVLSRQTVTGLKIPVTEIIAEIEPNAQRPALTKDLELWLSSMEESSQRYKKDNWRRSSSFYTLVAQCVLYTFLMLFWIKVFWINKFLC